MFNPERYLKLLPEYDLYCDIIGQYDNRKDYAGAEGKVSNKLVPRTLYGLDCNIAFYAHDALYSQGGNKKDRWQADIVMLATCLYIIENSGNRWFLYGSNWLRRHLARNRAIKYFEAVRACGHSSFSFNKDSTAGV